MIIPKKWSAFILFTRQDFLQGKSRSHYSQGSGLTLMCYSHCNKKATDLVPLSCSPETNLATEENARGIFKLLPDTLAYKCQTKCSML